MKKVLFLSMVIGFVCAFSFSAYAKEYKAEEASKHIGEKATVCGKIVDTMPYQGMTILGMGAGVSAQGAVGIEVSDSLKDKMPEDLYVGKEVCVSGEIHQNPSGGGSITVDKPSQIKAK